MQIGEFAKICNTKISVLRHYDKEGLLRPDYIDRFTGYRYYSNEQVNDYFKISALKNSGFSLAEIKVIIKEQKDNADIIALFDKKKAELEKMLSNLAHTKKTLFGVEQEMKTNNSKTDNEIILKEDINLPFENDDTIIGKWEIVGEFAEKSDFYEDKHYNQDTRLKEIYFLPNGERYWCYGWTKGKLIIDSGDAVCVNNYITEAYCGNRYMFVDFKSYNYRQSGTTTVLVLKQLDNKSYTADQIARKDDINIPFVDDKTVLGKWKVVGFCLDKKEFINNISKEKEYYFSNVEFKPCGEIISHYDYGKDIINSKAMQEWTKGFVLRKWNRTTCAYEIKRVDGKEYLIMEWKSGDYRWGGFDTDYYIFERV